METKKANRANLENKKFLFFEIGVAIILLGLFYAFEWESSGETKSPTGGFGGKEIPEETIPITQQKPPPPTEAPTIPVMSEIINIIDDDLTPEYEIIFSTEDNKNVGVKIKDYVGNTNITTPAAKEEEVEEDIPLILVEEKPKFMNGDENDFSRWVQSKFEYPEDAMRNGIQGRVYVQFVVNNEGRVVDITIARSLDASIDRELIRVIGISPKWTPGKQRGKEVRVKYTMPINLQLR